MMKRAISNFWPGLLWGLVLFGTIQVSHGSELVAVDDAWGEVGGGIGSMELYDNGLYWTVFGGVCNPEVGTYPSLAVMGYRKPPFFPERYLNAGCSPLRIGGAVRDDAYVYFTTPDGVNRKPVGASPSDIGALIGAAWNNLTPGAMMIYNGRAYYAYSSSTPIGGKGYFVVEYVDLPGAQGPFTPVVEVAHGNGLAVAGRPVKMGFMVRRLPSSIVQAVWGILLMADGQLLRFQVEQGSPDTRVAVVIATGVTDFAVRREQFPGIPSGPFFQDTLYVCSGNSMCPSAPASRLITLDPVSGDSTVIYTSVDGYINAVGTDQEYLFVSTYARQQPGGVCQIAGAGVIRSKRSYARLSDPGGVDPNWNAIEAPGGGNNLRSDGQYLYFTRNKEVRRLPNNSPALRHDFAALGLEAVQVVQDLNNSVRLVEGKRTIVRAYARVADTSQVQPDWFPNAELYGSLNGIPLPGPLYPVGPARITTESNLGILRGDAARSFQFELPAEWVRKGFLTLHFTVNPNLATYESGTSPIVNNSYSAANISVVQVQSPCFAFASMHSTTAPNYWPWEDPYDFPRIMERAKSLLPVPDIHVHPTTERVSDEHLCLRTCSGPFGIPIPCGFICNDPFDFTDSSSWSEALSELVDYDGFDQNRPGCSRTHYVGAIHPAVVDAKHGGKGRTGGFHFMALMDPVNAGTSPLPWAGRTIAHEFGHNLGRLHVDQYDTSTIGCGGNRPLNPDSDYPYDGCYFDMDNLSFPTTGVGFDTLTFKVMNPTNHADLMSYATNRWPSKYTYNAMMDALGTVGPAGFADTNPKAAPPTGPYLVIRGLLNYVQGTVQLKGCYSLPDGIADPAKVSASLAAATAEPAHGYTVRKLNGAGVLIEETPLILVRSEDGDEEVVVLHQFITKPAGMTILQIVHNGMVLAEASASAASPVISSVAAAYNATSGSVAITINATDADGDPLLFSTQFSSDNGASWRTLRVNQGSLSFAANARFLAGGTQCRVRVVATDGFNSTVATSNPFNLPKHAPEVFISGVQEGERLPHGGRAALLGFALDAENGSLPGSALTWTLAGPTAKTGTGGTLSLNGLAPGLYTATLAGQDADGSLATSVRNFEILPLIVPEGTEPIVDGDISDVDYTKAAVVQWPLGGRTTARLLHSGTNLYIAFSDLSYHQNSPQPAVVGVRVDANASGGAGAQAGDRGFFVDDNGTAFQAFGNGTIMQVDTAPPLGFKAVISRGSNGWNAEFRISESLLGGWNHAARILLQHDFLLADNPGVSVWPTSAGRNVPNDWARAWFGSILPALTNKPPVARAASPPVVTLNGSSAIILDGRASFDPEGSPLTFAWSQLAGPAVSLNSPATATPSFSFAASGSTTFRFRLVVNDGQTNSQPADVQFTVIPETAQTVSVPPVAVKNQNGSVTVGLYWPHATGERVIVQASTNLVHWQNIATNTVSLLQHVVLKDIRMTNFARRFFRLASLESTNIAYLVMNNNDSGPGSLREVIQAAPPNSVITFSPFASGTISLASGELTIDKNLTIQGLGAKTLAISGAGTNRVFNISTGTVVLADLTIRDGLHSPAALASDGRGGGVFNRGQLVLSNCVVIGNRAVGSRGINGVDAIGGTGGNGLGGGIYNTGTLALVNCTFTLNEARGATGGKGDDRLTANSGYQGGVGGQGLGGAICNDGVLNVTNCTFASNLVAGATGGLGGEGGLFTAPGGRGGNAEGAALLNRQSLVLMHTTLAGNTSQRGVGGPNGGPTGTASAGGLRSLTATAYLFNSIVASNSLGGGSVANGPDVLGNFSSQGYNLIGMTNGSAGWVLSDQVGNSVTPLNPLLGFLQDNGGQTPTMAPLAGSPAIDKGKSFGVLTDQPGRPRPVDFGAIPNSAGGDGTDVGAFEQR